MVEEHRDHRRPMHSRNFPSPILQIKTRASKSHDESSHRAASRARLTKALISLSGIAKIYSRQRRI